jgi:hypothetical protein
MTSWFYGDMLASEAEETLNDNKPMNFLFRLEKNGNCFLSRKLNTGEITHQSYSNLNDFSSESLTSLTEIPESDKLYNQLPGPKFEVPSIDSSVVLAYIRQRKPFKFHQHTTDIFLGDPLKQCSDSGISLDDNQIMMLVDAAARAIELKNVTISSKLEFSVKC